MISFIIWCLYIENIDLPVMSDCVLWLFLGGVFSPSITSFSIFKWQIFSGKQYKSWLSNSNSLEGLRFKGLEHLTSGEAGVQSYFPLGLKGLSFAKSKFQRSVWTAILFSSSVDTKRCVASASYGPKSCLLTFWTSRLNGLGWNKLVCWLL